MPGARLLRALFAALPDLGFAAACVITWVDPTRFGPRMVAHVVLVMLLEFFVVHSAGFMGVVMVADAPRWKRALWLVGLGALYTLFTVAYSIGFGDWWPAWAFWVLILNRLLVVLLRPVPAGDEATLMGASWVASVLFYLGGVFATVATDLPPLGITPEVIAAQGFTVGGLWTEEPWRPVAFGALYFTLQGIFELSSALWIGRRRGGAIAEHTAPGRRTG